jgi:predicted nucleic acid-binding protein
MGSGNLIDTNCIIDFGNGNLPISVKEYLSKIIDNRPSISIINKIEILGFTNQIPSVSELIDFVNVIGLTDDIVNETINIRKSIKIKLPDAIIAASAFSQNLTVLTRNTFDFKIIKGLQVINPWNL